MAVSLVEDLWGRIRAHIDDKITAATTASESAVAAAESAEADRVVVEQAATSASWSGDRLTVLGATSPPLTGEPGPAGATPYVGANGTWWVGDTDTGVRAQGEKGDSGDGAGDVLWSELNPVLDGKAAASHRHSWSEVDDKPSTYPPESHTHSQYATTTTVDGVSGRVTTLENAQPIIVSSLPSSPLPGRIYLVTG